MLVKALLQMLLYNVNIKKHCKCTAYPRITEDSLLILQNAVEIEAGFYEFCVATC